MSNGRTRQRARDRRYARRDSNPRLAASKAAAEPGFAEGSASRGPDVAALVHVLQDIRDGRYKPDEPLVHGLTVALDRAIAAAAAARSRKVIA